MREIGLGLGLGLAGGVGLGGCGYHLAGAEGDPAGPFVIEGGAVRTADVLVVAAAEDGARRELVRQGAARGGRGEGSAIVIEVLRVDEMSEAIAASPGAAGLVPTARAERVVVVAKAYLRRAGGGHERETGDVRVSEVVAAAGDAAHGMLARDDGATRAARRLGGVLVRKVLGYPEPGEW